MLQAFHWYTQSGNHWVWLKSQLGDYKKAGITALLLPPPCKCTDAKINVGYGIYDLWDLGKFDQKGQKPTKYGTEDELNQLCSKANESQIQVYFDAVFNHKAGADETEKTKAIVVAMDDRTREIGGWMDIEAWTKFTFPGRMSDPEGKQRSAKIWDCNDFDAVDCATNCSNWGPTIFKIKGKQFQTHVSWEKGNYDFLCFADIDMDSASAKDDIKKWGTWVLKKFGVSGFRFDAVKHVRSFFFREFAEHVKVEFPNLFCVGEYLESTDLSQLHHFISDTNGMINLFDVPLQKKFHLASQACPRNSYDLRSLLNGTLTSEQPALSVTYVWNHDNQPCQKLEQCVEPWFVPWAYAFILLRQEGYPVIFLPDITGAEYDDNGRYVKMYSHLWVIKRLLAARRHCAWGVQLNYFDHPNTVGWSRLGNSEHSGLASLINNGSCEGWKWMYTARPNTCFIDLLEHRKEKIFTNYEGWGCFTVNSESCSVWIPEDVKDVVAEML